MGLLSSLQKLLAPRHGSPLHSGPELLKHGLNSLVNDTVLAPRHALEKLAIRTSGAHPVNPGPAPPPFLLGGKYNQRELPMVPKFAPWGQPQPNLLTPGRPRFQATNLYGDLQPFGSQGEDNYSETQALQPTSYNSGQATVNGQFTQGPMSSFYKLRGF